jgi:hypothetical protein
MTLACERGTEMNDHWSGVTVGVLMMLTAFVVIAVVKLLF